MPKGMRKIPKPPIQPPPLVFGICLTCKTFFNESIKFHEEMTPIRIPGKVVLVFE